MQHTTKFGISIYIVLIFVGTIVAIHVAGIDYVVSKDTKCRYNVSELLYTGTAIKCATECGKRRGCSRVNFKRPQCEILHSCPAMEGAMHEEGDRDWKCIRKCLSDTFIYPIFHQKINNSNTKFVWFELFEQSLNMPNVQFSRELCNKNMHLIIHLNDQPKVLIKYTMFKSCF